jgi:hypothetical protein
LHRPEAEVSINASQPAHRRNKAIASYACCACALTWEQASASSRHPVDADDLDREGGQINRLALLEIAPEPIDDETRHRLAILIGRHGERNGEGQRCQQPEVLAHALAGCE